MQVLMFAAFSLISVPAYVAMFSSKSELLADESEDETSTDFEKHVEEMTAAASGRRVYKSTLFPTIHPRRFV